MSMNRTIAALAAATALTLLAPAGAALAQVSGSTVDDTQVRLPAAKQVDRILVVFIGQPS